MPSCAALPGDPGVWATARPGQGPGGLVRCRARRPRDDLDPQPSPRTGVPRRRALAGRLHAVLLGARATRHAPRPPGAHRPPVAPPRGHPASVPAGERAPAHPDPAARRRRRRRADRGLGGRARRARLGGPRRLGVPRPPHAPRLPASPERPPPGDRLGQAPRGAERPGAGRARLARRPRAHVGRRRQGNHSGRRGRADLALLGAPLLRGGSHLPSREPQGVDPRQLHRRSRRRATG